MLDNTYSQDNTIGRQFAEGTQVYDVHGAKVGTISEQGVQGDNLVLQKGLFFPHNYYVPLRTVTHEDADGIYLNVTKDDVTNQTFDNAPATYEELHMDRMPVGGNATYAGADAFTERDVDVPLRGEQVITNKEARIAEEVRLHKQQITENQQVDDTVRKEHVRIEGDGVDQVQGDVPLNRDTAAYEQNAEDAQPRRDI